jgi:hypothetical protein
MELRREFERVFDCASSDGLRHAECQRTAVVYWMATSIDRPVGRSMPGVGLRIVDAAGRGPRRAPR